MQCLGLLSLALLTSVPLHPKNPKKKEPLSVCMRNFYLSLVVGLGGIRLCLIFGSLQLVPMAIVHTLLNATPVVVMILSRFLLRDKFTALKVMASAWLLLGVALNSNPISAVLKAVRKSESTFVIFHFSIQW